MENKYYKDGGIGSYKENGTRSFVQTYTHDEVSIDFLDEKSEVRTEFIRLRIGTNEGQQIIMLENGKFYMIQGYATQVSYQQELSTQKLFQALSSIELTNHTIGNLGELFTNEKSNLVKAINEVAIRTSTPRHLVGYVKYATDGVDIEAEDLSVRYNDKTKRFEYYSDVDGWTLLPKGWQLLSHLARARDYLPTEPEEGICYGILNEDKVVRYVQGEWIECILGEDQIGDEYLVQEVYNKYFNGNATGSVIYTLMGWTYLVHYNYL